MTDESPVSAREFMSAIDRLDGTLREGFHEIRQEFTRINERVSAVEAAQAVQWRLWILLGIGIAVVGGWAVVLMASH